MPNKKQNILHNKINISGIEIETTLFYFIQADPDQTDTNSINGNR